MAQRGYILVDKEQVEAKARELAALNEEKKRRETAAAATLPHAASTHQPQKKPSAETKL